MELAPLQPADLKVAAALIKKSGRDLSFVDPSVLKAQSLGDPDFEAAFALKAVEKKSLLGVALGVARRSGASRVGWIKFLGVEARARRKGVGTQLCSELERRFQKRDVRELRVGACPAPYLSGGVNVNDTASTCFFLRRGYDFKDMVRDMTASLGRFKPAYAKEDAKLAKAVRLRKAGPKDAAALKALMQEGFPEWEREAQMGIDAGFCYVCEDGGKLVAFACGDATNPGWFGPTGALPSQRGRGLGRLLFLKSLEEMKRRGHKSVRIPWVGPIPFYHRFSGAEMGPVYFTMAKSL